MCGIVGVSSSSPNVCLSINNALTVLQHRGQDAAGLAVVNDKDYLSVHKGNGLVRDVFGENEMLKLVGNIGVGHVRYPTAGTTDISEAQPFYVNSPFGLVLVNNGNLVNTKQLRRELLEDDMDALMKESMESSKYFYCFERDVNARIDRLQEKLSKLHKNEGQKGSKDTYQESKEAS